MGLAGSVYQLNADDGGFVRLDAQPESRDIFDVQLSQVLDGGNVSAAAGEIAGELQARLTGHWLVLDVRERPLGAFEFFAAAEAPIVLAFENLIQANDRGELGAGHFFWTWQNGDIMKPQRVHLLVGSFGEQEVNSLRGSVPLAVLGAAPGFIFCDAGHRISLAAACEESLQRQ